MNATSATQRAIFAAEGEKRFCTLMALQWAEAMAASDGGPAFERSRDRFREYATRLNRADADLARLAREDFDATAARPLFAGAEPQRVLA